jgi:CubicO group peptidase (beta-lactamase class C family)
MAGATAIGGLDAGALAAMDAKLAGHVGERLPGLVALVARGDAVHLTVAGDQDAGGPPMRRDTIFRIASMTKPVAAAAAMVLVEEGRLALDAPAADWLPEFADVRVLARLDGPLDQTVPAARPFRVEELLTMTFGTGAIMTPGDFRINTALSERGIGPGPWLPDLPSMDAYAEALGSLPLMRQPGEFWLYDTGMQLLGVLIERAAGQPLGDFMAERLFEPLGMVDTGFFVPAAKIDRLAGIWWRDYATGALERFDGVGAESRFAAPPGFASASGGLVSTADDYLAFARMMANGGRLGGARILSAESVARMSRDRIAPAVKGRSPFAPGFWDVGGWGYGMQVVTKPAPGGPVGCGWVGGYGTSGYWDAASGLIGIHLTQRLMESPAPTGVFTNFWTGARAAAGV